MPTERAPYRPSGEPHSVYRGYLIYKDPWFNWAAFYPSGIRIHGAMTLRELREKLDGEKELEWMET